MSKNNIVKRILKSINDTSLSRAERTFNMLVSFGVIGTGAASLLSWATGGSLDNVLLLAALDIALAVTLLLANIFHRIKLAINIVAAVLTFVFLPINFFQVGGCFSGAPLLNVFGLAYVCMLVESRMRCLFFGGNVIILAITFYWHYTHPEFEQGFTRDMLFSDIGVTALIVCFLLCLMILFQNRIFKSENEMSLKQKKEIEELNLAQSRFFSSMSHEIRTPINTIIGLNELIQQECISAAVAQDAVRVQSAGHMLLALVNDILDLSKMEAGKMEITPSPYDSGEMLSELVTMMLYSAGKKGLEFRINVGNNVPAHLIGDETRVKQVLINILNNAIKYTEKGSVTLSVHSAPSSNGEGIVHMVYTIADTGIGIKQENIDQLFTVFKRVDTEKNKNIEGTGLGLSIVKMLVDLMGGSIEVNSVYTQGSTFVVRLPQKAEGDELINLDAIKARQGAAKKGEAEFTAPDARVLIVDDNETNLMVASRLLCETQAKIDTASSGEECLKKTQEEYYHMIFMDHIMPGMDGIECLHEIRMQRDGLNSETPIVVLTANAGSDNMQIYRREGFDGILLKPVTGRQMEDELLKHLPREMVISREGRVAADDSLDATFLKEKRRVPIMIVTDSTADLPRYAIKKNNIRILPIEIETDGGTFLDGPEIDVDGLIRYIDTGGKKVVQLEHAQSEFIAFFADCLVSAQRVVYLAESSGLVRHFNTASETVRSFASVSVFDTRQVSSGLGFMVLKAAELARQGVEPDSIMLELEAYSARIQTSFIVANTSYLCKTGKMSKVAGRVCEAFALRPILLLRKGRWTVASIKVGSGAEIWKSYIRWALRRPLTINKTLAVVLYAGIPQHGLEEIESEIRRLVPFDRIHFQKATAVFSVNCGQGAFGVIFARM